MGEPLTIRKRDALGALVAGGVATLMLPGESAVAAEAPLAKAPAKVRDAAKRVAPDVKWSGAEKLRDEDEDLFELTGKDGKDRDVIVVVTADGKAAEARRGVPVTDVPKEIWKVVAAKFPKFEAISAFEVRGGDDLSGPGDGELSYEVGGVYEKELHAILEISAEGEISHVERQIPLADVPKAVQTALKDKLPMFHPASVYEIFEEGEIVGYQYTGRRSKDKKAVEMDVFVSADGAEVDAEE